mmetsp:Transcript_27620/g.85600  ORF Transcript_27620/g.85600 Transcript_27620/m.85600 type:complete len:339 (+) Transcript_27620:445-1461(+)
MTTLSTDVEMDRYDCTTIATSTDSTSKPNPCDDEMSAVVSAASTNSWHFDLGAHAAGTGSTSAVAGSRASSLATRRRRRFDAFGGWAEAEGDRRSRVHCCCRPGFGFAGGGMLSPSFPEEGNAAAGRGWARALNADAGIDTAETLGGNWKLRLASADSTVPSVGGGRDPPTGGVRTASCGSSIGRIGLFRILLTGPAAALLEPRCVAPGERRYNAGVDAGVSRDEEPRCGPGTPASRGSLGVPAAKAKGVARAALSPAPSSLLRSAIAAAAGVWEARLGTASSTPMATADASHCRCNPGLCSAGWAAVSIDASRGVESERGASSSRDDANARSAGCGS